MISELSGRSLDIEGFKRSAGTPVVLARQNGCVTQQWYEDRRGGIRSRLNDFDLSVASEGRRHNLLICFVYFFSSFFSELKNGELFTLEPHKDELEYKNQIWMRSGDKIVNMFNPQLVESQPITVFVYIQVHMTSDVLFAGC